jgi:hypothetical protein
MGEVDGVGDGKELSLRFIFRFTEETDKGPCQREVYLPMSVFTAWEIAEAVQKLGEEQALTFARLAVTITKITPDEPPHLTPDETARLQAAIDRLTGLFSQQWETLEDRVIDFTYQWMLRKAMSREVAALFASTKLGPQPTDAYRKKVDRWVKAHGMAALGQTKRRPRK